MRGSWPIGLVRYARSQPNPPACLAEGGLPEVEEHLAKASRFTWLPFRLYRDLIEALLEQLGPAPFEALLGGYVGSLGSSPLYKPLISGIDLFGSGSLSMIRLYARGFTLSFRDSGSMRVAPREGGGVSMTLSQLPTVCRSMAYAHGHLGSMRGAYTLVGSTAEATMDTTRLRSDGLIEFVAIEQPR